MKTDEILSVVDLMRGKTLNNYVIAGLTSTLLTNGKFRLFECERAHYDFITPHSHRYDLTSVVLQGEVTNTIFKPVLDFESGGDEFVVSDLTFNDKFGSYEKVLRNSPQKFKATDKKYSAGHVYYMEFSDIHTIRFSKGAKVLVIEGPEVSNTSVCLEPRVNGEHIPTFETKPYMFKEQ